MPYHSEFSFEMNALVRLRSWLKIQELVDTSTLLVIAPKSEKCEICDFLLYRHRFLVLMHP